MSMMLHSHILEHKFVTNGDPSNMVGTISLKSLFDDVSLSLVWCIVIGNGVVTEEDLHIDLCLFNRFQLPRKLFFGDSKNSR